MPVVFYAFDLLELDDGINMRREEQLQIKPVVFYAFDLLELDGEDIARLPQLERKLRLEALLDSTDREATISDTVKHTEVEVEDDRDTLRSDRDIANRRV